MAHAGIPAVSGPTPRRGPQVTVPNGAYRRIVAGVDGSAGGCAALRGAAAEAGLHGGVVQAVYVWGMPFSGAATSFAPQPYGLPDRGALEQAAVETLHRVVTDVLGSQPPVEVLEEIRQGNPGGALVEAAREADLLVVGARGHGGFGGLLLGSVSAQVVRHAPCSVLVVRTAADPSGPSS